MIIPNNVRDCVVFICTKTGPDRFKMLGTGFFVSIDTQYDPDYHFTYLVTAKHVVDYLNQRGLPTWLRVNKMDGESTYVEVPEHAWTYHPTDEDSVDVAVVNWAPDKSKIKYASIPIETSITQKIIEREGIGPGTQVFLSGLFVNHYGNNRNLPIVRVGNIALMPEEPIFSKDFGFMDAVLIEARSIGGLSGSPVFVNLHGWKREDVGGRWWWYRVFLLGLMHGHWDVREMPVDANIEEDEGYLRSINMGIGLVVPAHRIKEVLDHPTLKQHRDEVNKQGMEERALTIDVETAIEDTSSQEESGEALSKSDNAGDDQSVEEIS